MIFQGDESLKKSLLQMLMFIDIYWQTLKTQHLDNSFNLCLEKEGRTIILIVC